MRAPDAGNAATVVLISSISTLPRRSTTMTKYLLSVYQPEGPIPAPDVLARISRDLEA